MKERRGLRLLAVEAPSAAGGGWRQQPLGAGGSSLWALEAAPWLGIEVGVGVGVGGQRSQPPPTRLLILSLLDVGRSKRLPFWAEIAYFFLSFNFCNFCSLTVVLAV
jgi:hypothetical protein